MLAPAKHLNVLKGMSGFLKPEPNLKCLSILHILWPNRLLNLVCVSTNSVDLACAYFATTLEAVEAWCVYLLYVQTSLCAKGVCNCAPTNVQRSTNNQLQPT